MNTTTTKTDFNTAITNFLNVAQEIINNHWKSSGYTHSTPPILKVDGGKKFLKITREDANGSGNSVHCFVEISTGNILKAASWKTPAKHSRGNIYDTDNGKSAMDVYGCRYLRG